MDACECMHISARFMVIVLVNFEIMKNVEYIQRFYENHQSKATRDVMADWKLLACNFRV